MIVYLGEHLTYVWNRKGVTLVRAQEMPLTFVRPSETATVARVSGETNLKGHLENLGFVEGSQIYVVSSSGSNMIVEVKGARLGVDAKVASRVFVTVSQ